MTFPVSPRPHFSGELDLIVRHAPKEIGVVEHDAILVDGKLCAKIAAVEVLEEVEPVREPRIRLRLWMNRHVRREDPGHEELPSVADRHRFTANREAVGEWSRPEHHSLVLAASPYGLYKLVVGGARRLLFYFSVIAEPSHGQSVLDRLLPSDFRPRQAVGVREACRTRNRGRRRPLPRALGGGESL